MLYGIVAYVLFLASFLHAIGFGVHIEERDLLAAHGDVYADYQRRMPMLIPRPGGKHG